MHDHHCLVGPGWDGPDFADRRCGVIDGFLVGYLSFTYLVYIYYDYVILVCLSC